MVEGSGRLPDTAVETPIGPQAPLLQKNGRELSSPKGAPVVIDGNAIAAQIRYEVGVATKELAPTLVPKLTVIIFTDNDGGGDNESPYLEMRKRACELVGIRMQVVRLSAKKATMSELLDRIGALNEDSSVHGISLDQPLPEGFDLLQGLSAINPAKDIDGLHPLNLATIATQQTHSSILPRGESPDPPSNPTFTIMPCNGPPSAMAALEVLDRSGVTLSGASAVVIGRSTSVGIPLSMLLMQRDATVTLLHARSHEPAHTCKLVGDIVVVAAGSAEMVTRSWIKDGAIVVDCGLNPINARRGGKACLGDVAFDEVLPHVRLITPVPGGVHPVTLAIFLRNIVQSAIRLTRTEQRDSKSQAKT